MASNNNELVFYQQWAVAGLQMDKYSTNPWCVDSKNLDIFSDSQSVKGTAWSEPTQIPSVDYVDVDDRWRFYLYADWTVYDSVEDITYNHDFFDANASNLDYLDWQWSQRAVYGTPIKIFVAYDWDTWRNITVVTDRTWHTRYNDWIQLTVKEVTDKNSTVWSTDFHGDNSYVTVSINSSTNFQSHRTLPWMTWGRIKMDLTVRGNTNPLEYWHIYVINHNLKRDESTKWWKNNGNGTTTTTDFTASTVYEWYVDGFWWEYGQNLQIRSKLDNEAYKLDEKFYLNEKWDYMLPWEKNFIQIDWTWYMFVPDQNLYEEIDMIKEYDVAWDSYWTIMTAGQFPVREWQEIIALTKTFDYRLVFCNDTSKEMWYVYLVPAWDDILSFNQWWEFAWMKFINATMINWYAYFIAENRWIRGLYIFYNWQIKKIASSDIKYTESMSLMDGKQIYDFTWPMFNWRGKVVAPTKTGIYMYWENKWWQNVGSFILKLENWTVNKVDVVNDKLRVEYSIGDNNYYKEYQDDINIKHYESEFSITYPVQISSHIVEKEPLTLVLSYNLPNDNTSLDVYVSVNDYHFWSFYTDWTVEPEVWDKFKVSWLSWDYWLKFVEKNWNWLTFTLDGDLPYQSSNTMNLVSEDTQTTIAFTDLNHFKKIWTITKTNNYEVVGKHRFLNITNKNDFPIVRKAQVKIVWKTDNHVSPQLYDVRLLSTQFDK